MADAVDLQQSIAWRASRRAAKRYLETGNALFAWEAAGHALAAGVPMPQAVQAYVARAATRLGARLPIDKRLADPRGHVFECLELGGRGGGPSAFERRRRFERARAVEEIANRIHWNMRILKSDALEHAAEDAGIEADSIARQKRRRTKLA